jgi:hypothetical protein
MFANNKMNNEYTCDYSPINFLCIDSISVCYTPDVIRNLFSSIAHIGHVFIHYHANPSNKLKDPVWWYKSGTQTVWISIREWNDTQLATNIICDLRNNSCSTISDAPETGKIDVTLTNIKDMLRFPIDIDDTCNNWNHMLSFHLDKYFDNLQLWKREPNIVPPKLLRQTNYCFAYQNNFPHLRADFQEPLYLSTKLSLMHPDNLEQFTNILTPNNK